MLLLVTFSDRIYCAYSIRYSIVENGYKVNLSLQYLYLYFLPAWVSK